MISRIPSTVYVLQHARPKEGCEDVKLIGVYSTEAAAERAIQRLLKQPGFSEYPNDFHLDRYEIDVDH